MTDFKEIPAILNEPIFQKAYSAAEIANFSPEEYKKYIDSLDAYREIKGVRETAIEERNIEIAKSLLETNLTSHEIGKHTGLTIEQIEHLRKETRKN